MERVEALRAVAALTAPDDLFVCSIGASRDDWWNLRPGAGTEDHNAFWPAIMGAVTTTALGLALALPHRRVVALDTDGSLLMNVGALCTVAATSPGNLTIVVLDNEAYEVTGSLPTHTGGRACLARMAEGAGLARTATAADPGELARHLEPLLDDGQPGLVVAKISLGRHAWTPEQRRSMDGVEDKYRFARYVERLEGIRFVGCGPARDVLTAGAAGEVAGR